MTIPRIRPTVIDSKRLYMTALANNPDSLPFNSGYGADEGPMPSGYSDHYARAWGEHPDSHSSFDDTSSFSEAMGGGRRGGGDSRFDSRYDTHSESGNSFYSLDRSDRSAADRSTSSLGLGAFTGAARGQEQSHRGARPAQRR